MEPRRTPGGFNAFPTPAGQVPSEGFWAMTNPSVRAGADNPFAYLDTQRDLPAVAPLRDAEKFSALMDRVGGDQGVQKFADDFNRQGRFSVGDAQLWPMIHQQKGSLAKAIMKGADQEVGRAMFNQERPPEMAQMGGQSFTKGALAETVAPFAKDGGIGVEVRMPQAGAIQPVRDGTPTTLLAHELTHGLGAMLAGPERQHGMAELPARASEHITRNAINRQAAANILGMMAPMQVGAAAAGAGAGGSLAQALGQPSMTAAQGTAMAPQSYPFLPGKDNRSEAMDRQLDKGAIETGFLRPQMPGQTLDIYSVLNRPGVQKAMMGVR